MRLDELEVLVIRKEIRRIHEIFAKQTEAYEQPNYIPLQGISKGQVDRSEPLDDNTIIDYGANGEILGIERI